MNRELTRRRVRFLCYPAGLLAWTGLWFALIVWPIVVSIGLLVALIGGAIYCAWFVWPFEDGRRQR